MKNDLWYNFDVPDFDSSCCSTSARLIFFHTAGVITLRLGAQRDLKMAIQLLHARCGSQQKWQNIVPSEHVHDIFFTCPYVPYVSSRTKIADIYSILNNHPPISGPSAYDHSLLPNITDGPTPTAGAPLAAPVFFRRGSPHGRGNWVPPGARHQGHPEGTARACPKAWQGGGFKGVEYGVYDV